VENRLRSFGEVNFGKAQLGDKRRTRRLVQTADLMCRRPGGTLPQKLRAPKDLRAFYRLVNCPEVTHAAVLAPHREATLEAMAQSESTVLVIHDATELDLTSHRSLEDLGQVGNGKHRGYIVQNSLAVDAETREVLGLCNQVLHRRATVSAKETTAQKRKRASRESLLWLKGTDPLPSDPKIVDICDQGADTFEFLEHEVRSKRRFVIRAAYDRGILIGHDENACSKGHLRTYASTLPEQGRWSLTVTSRMQQKSLTKHGKKQWVRREAREANMAVSFAPVQILRPRRVHGLHGKTPLCLWVIRVWEVDPPKGQERLEWFVLTNEPIENFDQAYRAVGWYECRWIIEEFHKGMKTGCSIEKPQFTTEDRLQPAIALISVVTLTLLALRDASRAADAKTRPARDIISEDYVAVLSGWRHGVVKPDWSIHDFFFALARLGGHQNRKSDHRPGWQVLWEGWKELQAMLCGADVMKQIKKMR
jgi:hypothetical protein